MSLFIAALFMSAQAAVAPPAEAAQPPAAAAVPETKQKKVCKMDDGDSASRMSKRVCKTTDEWNRKAEFGGSRSGMSVSGEAIQSH